MITYSRMASIWFGIFSYQLISYFGFSMLLSAAQAVEVMTTHGPVVGATMTSRSGRPFYSFTKIPYAKPPTGNLRFQNPEPADTWKEPLMANKDDMPICLQIDVLYIYTYSQISGVEDCLYLNVFTPSTNRSLPIMLFVMGGAFTQYFPISNQAARSKFLMDEDVVLVLPNYRVGALGFLTTEDDKIPGNFGLKDLAMAIQWIHKNAAAFGGDSSKITVFGNSAGSVSTYMLLTSPLTKDLIAGGISQSGSAHVNNGIGFPGTQMDIAAKTARFVGCPTTQSSRMLRCMQSKNATDIVNATLNIFPPGQGPFIKYLPVVEKKKPGAFMVTSPFKDTSNKPWITGITAKEFVSITLAFMVFPNILEGIARNMSAALPDLLSYKGITTKEKEITEAVISNYVVGESPIDSLSRMLSDGLVIYPAVESLRRHKGPKWLYMFDYRGKVSFSDVMTSPGNVNFGNLGAIHTDDLLYLFDFTDAIDPKFGYMKNMEDVAVSKTMVATWAAFARKMKPDSKKLPIRWEQYGSKKNFLWISADPYSRYSLKQDLGPMRMNFWASQPMRNLFTAKGL